jgi:hypothetical protein
VSSALHFHHPLSLFQKKQGVDPQILCSFSRFRNSAIEPVEWIDMIDDDQLARFGLQNGGAFDETLISSKWEAAAFVPALDSAYPDDYFLFAAADNDFITKNGVDPLGVYSDAYGKDIANQFLVWRVTLPSDPGLA